MTPSPPLINVQLKSKEEIERDAELKMAYEQGYKGGCASSGDHQSEQEMIIARLRRIENDLFKSIRIIGVEREVVSSIFARNIAELRNNHGEVIGDAASFSDLVPCEQIRKRGDAP